MVVARGQRGCRSTRRRYPHLCCLVLQCVQLGNAVMESDMAEQTTVTFRTSTETKARLDKLATAMRRSKSFLTNAAVEQFLAEEEAFIADVEAGLRELDEGQGVNGEDLRASLLEHIDDVARANKTG